MANRKPLVIASSGLFQEHSTPDIFDLTTALTQQYGSQNNGPFTSPGDVFFDFIAQGYVTPTGGTLTGVLSTASFPGSASNVAIAYVSGQRVAKLVGDASLTYIYTASRDTYVDLSIDGTITRTAVTNGAGAPSQAANTLRLEKVVTDGTAITSVVQLADITPILRKGSISMGNTVVVDQVNGSDTLGRRGKASFATVAAAITAAVAGDEILILPGTYSLAAGLVVDKAIAIRGYSASSTILQMTGVTANTDLMTISVAGVTIESLTLNLASTGHYTLRAVVFSGTSVTSSRLLRSVVDVTNCSASTGGTSNVYGVHFAGTGTAPRNIESIQNCVVAATSTGQGIKRALLVDTATVCSVRSSTFRVIKCATGTGTYYAVETNNASAILTGRGSMADGVDADISQTSGLLNWGDTLYNNNSNGLTYTTVSAGAIPNFVAVCSSTIPSNSTRFLYPGSDPGSASEIFVTLPSPIIAKSLGVGQPLANSQDVVVTIRKNGIDTPLVATLLAGANSASNLVDAISFNSGDTISVKVVTLAGGTNINLSVVLSLS